ncbi:MAG: hypothetical protein BIFFINMI_01952 [Phycisphaerae bacterium]|nr:hypothetical protein [Phycisphaerae bacterium]
MTRPGESGSPIAPGRGGLRFIYRALRGRNYKLYFAGQSVSVIGTWMTRIGINWLAWELSKSFLVLGVVGFAGQIPTLLLGAFAGVLIDSVSRRKLLVWTQVLSSLVSLMLAGLAIGHVIRVWQLVGLAVVQGLVDVVARACRQTFIVEMVQSREDLPNAIALNSSMVHMARLIGPSLGGLLIATAGAGYCFLADGVSYLAVIASLLAMRLPTDVPRGRQPHWLHRLGDGFRYALGFGPIRTLLILIGLSSMMTTALGTLVPAYADKVLSGGPMVLGWLYSASGVGALCGALYLASRATVHGLDRVIAAAAFVVGLAMIGFAWSQRLWLSLPLMACFGLSNMLMMASGNTVLQSIVDDDKRGRVMGLFTMAFFGMIPIGALTSGALAHRVGMSWTITGCGVGCLICSLWFAGRLANIRMQVRPMYEAKGLSPMTAPGLMSAGDGTSSRPG